MLCQTLNYETAGKPEFYWGMNAYNDVCFEYPIYLVVVRLMFAELTVK